MLSLAIGIVIFNSFFPLMINCALVAVLETTLRQRINLLFPEALLQLVDLFDFIVVLPGLVILNLFNLFF